MKKSFTLAEVLITIGIIGLIADMTIPTLVNQYEKKYYAIKLEQTYSTLQQAINRSVIDNGNVDSWVILSSPRTYEAAKELSEKYIAPYLKVAKTKEETDYKIKYLKGTDLTFSKYYKIYLANGIILNVLVYDINAFWFYVDINGLKKPDKMGKDIFLFALSSTKNQLYPQGAQITNRAELLDESYIGNCNKKMNGDRCTQIIMLDGWQMKEDYPW